MNFCSFTCNYTDLEIRQRTSEKQNKVALREVLEYGKQSSPLVTVMPWAIVTKLPITLALGARYSAELLYINTK